MWETFALLVICIACYRILHMCSRQACSSLVAWGVPIRPQETSPEQLRRWQERRNQVGSRIREIRRSRHLTQEALGLEAGLDPVTIYRIEWGRVSISYERLWDIAEVLEVGVAELFAAPSVSPVAEPHRRGRKKSSTRARLSVDPRTK